jgi:hypothetical protein
MEGNQDLIRQDQRILPETDRWPFVYSIAEIRNIDSQLALEWNL